jgi:hypothetical protein
MHTGTERSRHDGRREQEEHIPKRTIFALFAWFMIASCLITGYRHIYGINHPYQLVSVQKLNDPTLYPNDPFAETAYDYASLFWYVVAWLSRIADLSLVLFVFFLLNKFLFLLSGFRLGRTFFPNSRYAPVVGLVVMATFPELLFGNGYPTRDTNQTSLCIGALFLAIDAFLNKSWRSFALWLGIAMSLNLMFSVYGLTYLGASWLLYLRGAYSREFLKKSVIATIAGVLAGIPSIYLVLRGSTRKEYDPISVWQACELSYGYHFYPQLWEVPQQLAALLLGIAVIFLVYRFRNASPVGDHLIAWTVVAAGWYLVAWGNIIIFHLLPLLHLHPVRALTLWQLASTVFLTTLLVRHAQDCNIASRKWLLWSYASLTVIIVFLDKLFMHTLFAALVVLGVIVSEIWRRVHLYRGVGSGASLLTLTLASVVSLSAPGVLLGTLIVMNQSIFSFQLPPIRLAEWARQNTTKEAVFLIPLQMGDGAGWSHFRHVSQRNLFTQQKDGSAWTYAPWFAEVWLSRLKALGYYEFAGLDERSYTIGSWLYKKDYKRFYDTIDDKKVEQLKKQYRIDYWITRATVKSRFPKVYEHEGWQVLKVSD